MKMRPVGAELFHADGQTERHGEVNCRFSPFCDAPNKLGRKLLSADRTSMTWA